MISYIFHLLFILIPIVFYPKTSEVFELNKITLIYIFTVIITAFWIIKMIIQKKIIFKRTLLDIPLIIFLISQLVSTIFSIDQRTSFFGYYSRFNGGLISIFCYSLLYWAYVSNLNKKQTLINLRLLIITGLAVSFYAILEHFGKSPSCLFLTGKFDVNCWVQDVQTRVFATIGQPNWLASFLAALIPLNLFLIFRSLKKPKIFLFWLVSSLVLFFALIFTKSRSGILGLAVSFLAICGFFIFKKSKKIFFSLLLIIIIAISFFLIKSQFLNLSNLKVDTSLSQEGTESADIRKIVWAGGLKIAKHYPLFGSGVETFAYAYYQFRPQEHNLVSEWDFLYNKAHNEYLNFLANTGLFGLISYLVFISASSIQTLKLNSGKKEKYFNIFILASLVSLFVTNFFGFSISITNLLLFLLPAIAINFQKKNKEKEIKLNFQNLNINQKVFLLIVFAIAAYLIFKIGSFWYADFLYNSARQLSHEGGYKKAVQNLTQAINISPQEAIYHDELANTYADIAIVLLDENEKEAVQIFTDYAVIQTQKAYSLSPKNININRNQAIIYIKLSSVDPKYLTEAVKTLKNTINISPTDPKNFLTLGKIYLKTGNTPLAIETLEKALDLKPNYSEARITLALIYKTNNQKEKARENFEYILNYISPDDELIKKELESL